jgi:predicted PurR-regulated permease PerM
LATVLAGTLSHLQKRLTRAVGGRRSLSAGLITLGVVVLLLAPLSFVGVVVVKEALGATAFVRRTLDQHGWPGLLGRLPGWLARWVSTELQHASTIRRDLEADFASWSRLRQVVGASAGVVGSTSHLLLMTALMLVTLFFLLRDGPSLVEWIERTPAMPAGRVRAILLELREVSKSVLGAQLGSGLAQSVVATIGYAITGIPDPVVFGIVSLIASFVPVGGVSLVGVPLAGLLWLAGRPGRAAFLAIWIVLLTGLIDNVLRPLLVRGRSKLNSGLVFLSLLGGLCAFGPIGIVVGPLSLALFLSVSAILRGEQDDFAD